MLVGDVANEVFHAMTNSTTIPHAAMIPENYLMRHDVSFMNSMIQAFVMVSVAEVFDKTWFMAIIMAMTFGKWVSFWGSSLALQAHVVVAAVFGIVLSKVLSGLTLLLCASCLYFVFFVLYSIDVINAEKDSDIFAAGMEESREDAGLDEPDKTKYGATGSTESPKAGGNKDSWGGFWKTFMAVFIAEWGDRTQIAMIGQHASLPIIPVCIGSSLAFFMLTASAVVVSGFVDTLKISERHVNMLAAGSFLFFFIVTVLEAMDEMGKDPFELLLHSGYLPWSHNQ